jgi:hypothetical protein
MPQWHGVDPAGTLGRRHGGNSQMRYPQRLFFARVLIPAIS